MGLPRTATKMLTTILNYTIYKLKTGYGLSARTYMSNAFRQIIGTGQGSCASPSIWVAILDQVLWSIANKYTCFRLKTPFGAGIDIIGDTYVDNNALICLSQDPNFTSNQTAQKISKHMEKISQDFESKLFSIGVSLSLNKCFWYLISWQ